MEHKQASQVTIGVIMIVLGLIFLGERLTVVPAVDIGRLWPVILIIFGVGRMVAPHRATPDPVTGRVPVLSRVWAGFWFLFLGVLFLLDNYDVLGLDQSWPLFIVAGGLSMLLGRRHAPPPPAGSPRT
jgi:LiaF transmembrane domain